MPTPSNYIEQLAQLAATGEPFVAVTLVESVGSTPQNTGTKMLVTKQGLAHGTVGGGKIEFKAIQVAQQMLTTGSHNLNQFVDWNLRNDVGMTCGGAVKLYFESYNRDDWHVALFGAGHVAQAVVGCLLTLDCRITCIDSRQEWLDKLPQSDRLAANCMIEPATYVDKLSGSEFVVCMTMGHGTDLPILRAIFARQLKPAYLGVIGSRAKRKILLRELAAQGVLPETIGEFHCPIGLPLGTNQPAEIAISIVAQMIQQRDKLRSAQPTRMK